MRPPLARAILQLYGESPVLDPMAGIGTTLVEAILLGMDAVGIEYEKKFVRQANANIKHVQKQYPNLGKAICIQGDARDLSCLNSIKDILLPKNDFNSIIFSPPFGDSLSMRNIAVGNDSKRELQKARSGHISVDKNLPMPFSANKGNICNLPYFNSIVFSPPYFCAISDAVKSRYGSPRTKKGISRRQEYSGDPNNIGNIPEFGSIVFSPPYGEANRGGGIAKRGYEGKHGKDEKLKDRCDRAISDNSNNISNILYGSTYLGEMLKVYRECYRILKPNKFCVVVVKDIRRKGLTIPLGCNTVKLLQLAGFNIFLILL
jgi:tRNA G10  N-methylase Trm11